MFLTINKYQIPTTINLLTNNHYSIHTNNNKFFIKLTPSQDRDKVIKLLKQNFITFK
jgi:uncharacterized membrane protein YobD (UPF0266 family)